MCYSMYVEQKTKYERMKVSMINYGEIKYGDILDVDFGEQEGNEQGGIRPAVVISNNVGNKFSPTINVAPLTSQWKNNIPVHVIIKNTETNGLSKESTILIEQNRVINKTRILKKRGTIDDIQVVKQINKAISIQFNLAMA